MALPAAVSNAANNSLAYGSTSLVPLRVNVVSDDMNTCIVDTMVLDRTCWPVPLFYPLEDAIERNAEELAYTLLTDMEVHGMGRTVRHFTGRVDLWSSSLFKKMVEQLRPQLREVARTSKILPEPKSKRITAPSPELLKDGPASKKIKTEHDKDDSAKNEEVDKKVEKSDNTETPALKKKTKKASLIPIRLRLAVNGIRIHDDFIWDLNVPQCPIEFAQNLGNDLNLPDEAVAAVVTAIVEQLDGAVVEDTKDLEASSSGAAAARKHATAAWPLEHRVHINNMAQLLALHRPTPSKS